ncbi:MAG: hypothetical protein E7510_07330 [Ruminococcus sp.]|nr:hypothetical protein [Ruminococcus sp.]
MKKSKSIILKILLVIVIILVVYATSWFAFYFLTVKPHISDSSKVTLYEKKALETYYDSYIPNESIEYTNKPYDNYIMYVPRLFSFSFYVTGGSSINFDTKKDTCENPTGSKYYYGFMADVDVFGKIKNYNFEICIPTNEGYLDCTTTYRTDKNGNLLNKDELSEENIKLFNDAKNGVCSMIETTNTLFGFQ